MKLDAKILTVSDGVIAGTREDKSGEALKDILEANNFSVVEKQICADGTKNVKQALIQLAKDFYGVIITTGGTGFGVRDLTPEATKAIIQKDAPGLSEAMRLVNPLGRLSRGIAGTYKNALILNVPGSPKGATECLEAVIDVIPHALELMAGKQPH